MSSIEYLKKLIILPLVIMVLTILVLRGPWLTVEYEGKVDHFYLYQNSTDLSLTDGSKFHAIHGLGWTNFSLIAVYVLVLGLYHIRALPAIVKTYTFRINLIPMICQVFYIAMIIEGFFISTEIDCEGYDELTNIFCKELKKIKLSHGWALYVTFVPLILSIGFMINSFMNLDHYIERFEKDDSNGDLISHFVLEDEDEGQAGGGGNPVHNNAGNPPSLMDQQTMNNNQILQTIIQSMAHGEGLSLDQVKESQRIIKFQYEQEVFQIKKQELLLQQQREQQESRAKVLQQLKQQEEMLSLQNNINDDISVEQQFIDLHHNLENNKY